MNHFRRQKMYYISTKQMFFACNKPASKKTAYSKLSNDKYEEIPKMESYTDAGLGTYVTVPVYRPASLFDSIVSGTFYK